MNCKKYIDDPRVHISTRKSIKDRLSKLFPDETKLSVKLEKSIEVIEDNTRNK